jgi:hypothetical protein
MGQRGTWLRRLYESTASWFGFGRRPVRKRRRPRCEAALELELLESRTLPSVGTGTGLFGQYYSDQTLTHLIGTRTDQTINFDWSSKAPAPGLTSEHFSVRWTGQVQALKTEATTFFTFSDDGVRLLVNGSTIINDWNDHAGRVDSSVPLNLVAGQKYNIELDYYQNAGKSAIQLSWASPNLAKEVIPTSQLYPVSGPVNPPPIPSPPPPIKPPPPPPVTPDWFSLHLVDPTLRNQARTLDADGSLNRNDLLSLFSTVEARGSVTAAELTDLRTLVSNATYLHLPGYTANLANKVVNGDPANGTYQNQPLGNLHTGSSPVQLENLVNKWFLGKDHPAISGPVTSNGITYTISYTLTAGSLFGANGANYADVKQGVFNDCYFVAALSEIAKASPQAIKNAFIDNGDGTYTVRFFNNGVPDYVTVDRYLPTYVTSSTSPPKLWYAGLTWLASNPNNILWAPLLEKAYIQIAASGWTRGPGAANAYPTINNGWEGTVIQQIANRSVSSTPIINSPATFNSIVAKFEAGQMVGLDSNAKTAPGIVHNHVYVVVGYNTLTHLFDCYNVWGYHQFLSWSQIVSNFFAYSYTL